jgi:hypothetical protein
VLLELDLVIRIGIIVGVGGRHSLDVFLRLEVGASGLVSGGDSVGLGRDRSVLPEAARVVLVVPAVLGPVRHLESFPGVL